MNRRGCPFHASLASTVRWWIVASTLAVLGGHVMACDSALPAKADISSSDQGRLLRTAASLDPLVLARMTLQLGDDAILQGLGEDQSLEVQLVATHASPWLRQPTEALTYLAPLAAGRDSVLAPAAAQAAQRIAEAIDADVLATQEELPEALAEVHSAYATIAADASARADIRLRAGVVAERLQYVGAVPEPK